MNEIRLPTTPSPTTAFVNFKAVAWVDTLDGPTGFALALLNTIARHSDEFGCSWCNRKTLARKTGCSTRTVSSHLGTLEALGLVRRIGRLGDHGGRISSVLVLRGWPDRKPIPAAGHPKLGRNIKEDRFEALERAFLAQGRKPLPEPQANPALQNIVIEINTTTDAENTKILERAFEALGRWATEENREHLGRDLGTLEALIGEGHDFEHVILPVLRDKSAKAPDIPTLRTWRYFLEPIAVRSAAKAGRRRLGEAGAKAGRTTSQATKRDGDTGAAGKDMPAAVRRVLTGSVKKNALKSNGEQGW